VNAKNYHYVFLGNILTPVWKNQVWQSYSVTLETWMETWLHVRATVSWTLGKNTKK